MTLTGRQIREARILTGMSLAGLAAELRIVGTPSLGRIEMYDGAPPISEDYGAAIRRALEAVGVEFIPENGGGAGVRLRKVMSSSSRFAQAFHPEKISYDTINIVPAYGYHTWRLSKRIDVGSKRFC